MRHGAILAAILVPLALAGPSAAGSPSAGGGGSLIQLPVHGTLALANSSVRCGSGTVNNKIFVDCGMAGANNEPKKGGFVALMTEDGKVAILNSTTFETVFSRGPASAWAGTPVRAGDTFVLPGTAISCNATKPAGRPTVTCFFLDAHGIVLPGSTSFRISDAALTTLAWSKTRQPKLLDTWRENG